MYLAWSKGQFAKLFFNLCTESHYSTTWHKINPKRQSLSTQKATLPIATTKAASDHKCSRFPKGALKPYHALNMIWILDRKFVNHTTEMILWNIITCCQSAWQNINYTIQLYEYMNLSPFTTTKPGIQIKHQIIGFSLSAPRKHACRSLKAFERRYTLCSEYHLVYIISLFRDLLINVALLIYVGNPKEILLRRQWWKLWPPTKRWNLVPAHWGPRPGDGVVGEVSGSAGVLTDISAGITGVLVPDGWADPATFQNIICRWSPVLFYCFT